MNNQGSNFFVCHKCWNENLECTDCHGITNNMPNKPLAERTEEYRHRIDFEKHQFLRDEVARLYRVYTTSQTYGTSWVTVTAGS